MLFLKKKRQGLPLTSSAVSHSPPLPRPRTSFDDVRSPTNQEWRRWSLMPRLQLWEAVALLCDIEPPSLPVEGAWQLAKPGTPASTFWHRFRIAVAHHSSGTLRCTASRDGFNTDLQVFTSDFAAWARRMGWELPSALAGSWRPDVTSAPLSEPASPREVGESGAAVLNQSDHIRKLEAAEAQRRKSTRAKAQQASAARWSGLEQHKLRAIELANSKPFPSRTQAAEFARDRVAKNEEGDLYAVQTVDDWLRAAGWKKPPK